MARNIRNYRFLWQVALLLLFITPQTIYADPCHVQADSLYKLSILYYQKSKDRTNVDARKDSLTAERYFKEVLSLSCEGDSIALKYADKLYQLARKELRSWEHKIDLFSGALSIRKRLLEPAHPGIINSYANIIDANRRNYSFDAAEDAINAGLRELKGGKKELTFEDSTARAYFYWHSAQLFIQTEDLYMAKRLSALAWNMYLGLDDRYYLFKLHAGNQRGVIFNKLNDVENGIPHLLSVEKVYHPQRGFSDLDRIYQNLGNIYLRADSFDKAIEYYSKAIVEADKRERKDVIADCSSNMGILYQRKGELHKAIPLQNKAIQLDSAKVLTSEGRAGLSRRFDAMGDVYRDSTLYDQALDYYQKAIKINCQKL